MQIWLPTVYQAEFFGALGIDSTQDTAHDVRTVTQEGFMMIDL